MQVLFCFIVWGFFPLVFVVEIENIKKLGF